MNMKCRQHLITSFTCFWHFSHCHANWLVLTSIPQIVLVHQITGWPQPRSHYVWQTEIPLLRWNTLILWIRWQLLALIFRLNCFQERITSKKTRLIFTFAITRSHLLIIVTLFMYVGVAVFAFLFLYTSALFFFLSKLLRCDWPRFVFFNDLFRYLILIFVSFVSYTQLNEP